MKTKLIIFLVFLTFMSLFSISSALFADEFSEFESVVKSKKMACFYEIGGNPATINYRYDGTNLFTNQEVFGENRVSLNEVKQKPGKDIFLWKLIAYWYWTRCYPANLYTPIPWEEVITTFRQVQ